MKCHGNLFIKMLLPVQPIPAAYCGEPCVEIAVETRRKGARHGMFCLRCPENLSHQPRPHHLNITDHTPAFSRLSLTCITLYSSLTEQKSFRARACLCITTGSAIVKSTEVSSSYLSLLSVRIAYAESFGILDGYVELKQLR